MPLPNFALNHTYGCALPFDTVLQMVVVVLLTLMLDGLPLSGLRALDDGLAEEGAHLLDSGTNHKSTQHPRNCISVFPQKQMTNTSMQIGCTAKPWRRAESTSKL